MLKSKLSSGLYFIAEFGQNHQGDIKIAKQMVDALVGSGVSAIKSAKRNVDICLSIEQKRMIYDNPNSFGKTYYDHRKALELSETDYFTLKKYVENAGFDFISSFTDQSSLQYLIEIDIKYLKIASQRITDLSLLEKTAELFDGTVIMSSGMSGISDIDLMVNIFKNNQKYLLQCTSVYPCPEKLLNLNILHTYKDRYKMVNGFGLSGHHSGVAPDIAAYVMGFPIIERHFTLDRAWKGTDHAASLEVKGVQMIIKFIQQIYESMGSPVKGILPEEMPALLKLRQDLVDRV